MATTPQQILQTAYEAFNARDIQSALDLMHPEVEWPNGFEGGSMRGHDAVREYWTRQWTQINPHVEPMGFSDEGDGRIVVDVQAYVKDLAGKVIVDELLNHVFELEDGLIVRMRIQPIADPHDEYEYVPMDAI